MNEGNPPCLKPRIKRFGSSWSCASGARYAGIGNTPIAAFRDWEEQNTRKCGWNSIYGHVYRGQAANAYRAQPFIVGRGVY